MESSAANEPKTSAAKRPCDTDTDTDTKKEPTVVNLTSSATIAASTGLYFTCSSAVEIEPCSGHRIFISASARKAVTIVPSDCLGHDFACRWHKLSDELKVHILQFNLISEDPVEYGTTLSAVERRLHKHLAMGPEIASLSQEIYYKENTFRFYSWYFLGEYEFAYLPSVETRPFIRNVELCLCVQGSDWRLCRRSWQILTASIIYGRCILECDGILMPWNPS
jgi:hypothetical protein